MAAPVFFIKKSVRVESPVIEKLTVCDILTQVVSRRYVITFSSLFFLFLRVLMASRSELKFL